ncbi:MAG: hypothetical protein LBJ57_06430 [Prevotellaceae bacterium]|jgi:hypothetical protein|nr:hypothetical protein [Prevotellaceae bacterium]
MMKTFIYIVIPAIALVALIWSNKSVVKSFFARKKVQVEPTSSAYDIAMSNPAVQFALSWKNNNSGTKQAETVFRNNGKVISHSASYKKIHKMALEAD